jgi:hypothetical protein
MYADWREFSEYRCIKRVFWGIATLGVYSAQAG